MKNTDKANPAPVDGQDGVPQKTAPSTDPTPVAPKKQAPAATGSPVDSTDQADAATPDDKTADKGGAESTGQIPAFDHEHKYNEVVVLPSGKKYRVGIGGRTHPCHDNGELFEMKPFMDDGDGNIRSEDDTIRLAKGDAYKVQVTAFYPERCEVVRHYWQGGMPLVCPAKTAPEFLKFANILSILGKPHPGTAVTPEEELKKADQKRPCPLCALMPSRYEYYLPVRVHAKRAANGTWEPCSTKSARVLRLTASMWRQFKPAAADEFKSLLIVSRNDDEYGTYQVTLTDEPAPEIKGELARPLLEYLRVEDDETLAELAETLSKSRGLDPQPGRVAKLQKIFPGIPLIAFWWGRKKPVRAGYLDEAKARAWMRDPDYLRRMDEGGIALLILKPYAVIDLDRDEDLAEFARLNPWVARTHTTIGGRGAKYFVKVKDDYPQRVIHVYANSQPVGEFRGATTAILDNLHPSGKLYKVRLPDLDR